MVSAQIYTIHLTALKTFIIVFDTFVPHTDELWFNNAQIYTKTFNSCAFNWLVKLSINNCAEVSVIDNTKNMIAIAHFYWLKKHMSHGLSVWI